MKDEDYEMRSLVIITKFLTGSNEGRTKVMLIGDLF